MREYFLKEAISNICFRQFCITFVTEVPTCFIIQHCKVEPSIQVVDHFDGIV